MGIDLICIVCPMGCRLTIEEDKYSESGFKVIGNNCRRGEEYALKEIENPTRVITTTVIVKNHYLKRLPVRTNGEIPKKLIFKCMDIVNKIEVESPIKIGEVIVENILDTGVDMVASRSLTDV